MFKSPCKHGGEIEKKTFNTDFFKHTKSQYLILIVYILYLVQYHFKQGNITFLGNVAQSYKNSHNCSQQWPQIEFRLIIVLHEKTQPLYSFQ